MRAEACGSTLTILRDLGDDPAKLAAALRKLEDPNILNVVLAYETIGVHHPEFAWNPSWVELVNQMVKSIHVDPPSRHRIPVCYELGDDFSTVCDQLGLAAHEFASRHSSAEYRCVAIGFCPGFPYLEGLPEPLRGLPRLESPRARVPMGSVAITGNQCAIYPSAVPGGWNLIGRCPIPLVDIDHDFFPIQAGDFVRFEPIPKAEFDHLVRHQMQGGA